MNTQTLPIRGRGMYGPFRLITAVGSHESTGTLVTLECGHQWTLAPHAHMDPEREVGRKVEQCVQCKAQEATR